MELTKKEIDSYYISRMIDSLEKDYDEWKITHCEGPGMSWTDFNGPISGLLGMELLKQISAKNKSEDLSETSSKKRNNSEKGEVK